MLGDGNVNVKAKEDVLQKVIQVNRTDSEHFDESRQSQANASYQKSDSSYTPTTIDHPAKKNDAALHHNIPQVVAAAEGFNNIVPTGTVGSPNVSNKKAKIVQEVPLGLYEETPRHTPCGAKTILMLLKSPTSSIASDGTFSPVGSASVTSEYMVQLHNNVRAVKAHIGNELTANNNNNNSPTSSVGSSGSFSQVGTESVTSQYVAGLTNELREAHKDDEPIPHEVFGESSLQHITITFINFPASASSSSDESDNSESIQQMKNEFSAKCLQRVFDNEAKVANESSDGTYQTTTTQSKSVGERICKDLPLRKNENQTKLVFGTISSAPPSGIGVVDLWSIQYENGSTEKMLSRQKNDCLALNQNHKAQDKKLVGKENLAVKKRN